MTAPSEIYRWNTGRHYSADGQHIAAQKTETGILFYDMTRGLAGIVPHNSFLPLSDAASVQRHVMNRYDACDYRPCAEASAFASALDA